MLVRNPLLALATVAMLASTVSSASARDGISPGAAAAVGVLGGLAIGGAIAGSQQPYYPGRPVYSPAPPPYYEPAPRPVYVAPIEEEGESCYIRRRRTVDEFGDVVIRRVRVCE